MIRARIEFRRGFGLTHVKEWYASTEEARVDAREEFNKLSSTVKESGVVIYVVAYRVDDSCLTPREQAILAIPPRIRIIDRKTTPTSVYANLDRKMIRMYDERIFDTGQKV